MFFFSLDILPMNSLLFSVHLLLKFFLLFTNSYYIANPNSHGRLPIVLRSKSNIADMEDLFARLNKQLQERLATFQERMQE